MMIMPMQLMCRTLFNISNLGEYHNLYVRLDTALLADVFESFRDKHIETDKLDPSFFLTTPGLSWEAF